jgi:hypothetical protein
MKLLYQLLMLYLLLNTIEGFAQNKGCNFEIDKTDEFTAERLVQTTKNKIIAQIDKNLKINGFAHFKYKNGSKMLGLNATYRLGGGMSVFDYVTNPAQAAVDAAMQDAVVVRTCHLMFEDKSNFRLETNPDEYQTKNSTTYFNLTDEQLQKILTNKVIKIRLEFGETGNSETTFDCDIKDKSAQTFQSMAQCITEIK